jgi:hypothetical protein
VTVYEVPPHLSHSQSSNLLGEYCGASYWYERVLGKPSRPGWAMMGGSALHEGSEAWDWGVINEGLIDDSQEYLTRLFNDAFDKQIAETLEASPFPKEEWNRSGREIKTKVTMDGGPNKKDEAWWRAMGPEMLRLWTAWRLTSGWEIAHIGGETAEYGIEVPFEVDVDGEPVRGYIDRVFERSGEYLVVDLKSGRQPDDTSQLGVYRYGLAKQYGFSPRWGSFWLGGSGSATALTDLEKLWPDRRVEQRYRKARADQLAGFFIHKPSNLCGSCGVREYCPIVGGAKATDVPQPWEEGIEVRIAAPSQPQV